jgi:hypothetical protein
MICRISPRFGAVADKGAKQSTLAALFSPREIEVLRHISLEASQ